MEDKRALEITEKILTILEDNYFIDSKDIHDDAKKDTVAKKYPALSGVTDKEIRILSLREWIHAEPKGPNPQARISSGASYLVYGAGPMWVHYQQMKMTVGIANEAKEYSRLAIVISILLFVVGLYLAS